jgi:prevent-host-death family protein
MGAVEQIPIRVLNQDTAAVLARVARGETVEITSRGRPVARITPIADDRLSALVAAGRVLPPTIITPFGMPTTPAGDAREAGELLRELRDEERW